MISGDVAGGVAAAGPLIAVATTDDWAPTATLRRLGIRGDVAVIACGGDGVGVKPGPAMLLAICQATVRRRRGQR